MSRGERVASPEGPLATSGTTADEWVRPPEVDSGRRSGPVGGGEPRLSAHLFFYLAVRARTRRGRGKKKPVGTPKRRPVRNAQCEIGLARNRCQKKETASPMRVRLQQHAEVGVEFVEDRQRGRPEGGRVVPGQARDHARRLAVAACGDRGVQRLQPLDQQ